MNCQDAIERLSEYLDRALPQGEASAVESHLASCAACREELDELRKAIDAVKTLPKVRAPKNFAAGVMVAIRAEAPPVAEPVKVTPIRSAVVFMRLLASVAAICLVWVGVRSLQHPEVSAPGRTAHVQESKENRATATAKAEEFKNGLALKEPDAAKARNADKVQEKPDAPVLESHYEAKSAGNPPAPAAPENGLERAGKEGWAAGGVAPNDSQSISVQRITVYSTDAKVDSQQVQKLLSDSGYTWSTQSKAILVRVPASEASRLVASLGAMPGGFRAADRKSLESLERLRKVTKAGREEEKMKEAPAKDAEVAVGADDLKVALRDHIDETRRQIEKQESAKKDKSSLDRRGGAPAAGLAGGVDGGSHGEGKADPRTDAPAETGVSKTEHDAHDSNEEAAPGAKHGEKDPAVAGGMLGDGKPAEGGEFGASQAGAGGGPRKPAGNDLGPAKGGTDEFGDRARREKEQGDELADEYQKQKESKKLSDAEDAVVIYIEFAEPPAADPAATPTDK
ncbi:MAG: zf-HC2 domain-containing protein [Planctomycetes bacterium]|nr:zf-HC2 domain-containing protein [Planctomycetota bacterium]